MLDRRRLLEVLKWVPPEDNLCCTSLVSRFWCEASNTEEVWASLYSDSNLSLNFARNQSPKEAFRLFYQHQPELLPLISCKWMELFNCKLKTITSELRFKEKLELIDGTATVLLPTGGLIACGGGDIMDEVRNQAYHASSTGEVEQLQNMRNGRGYHSVAVLRESLYVFCGDEQSGRSSEKLRIEPLNLTRAWEPLPSSLLVHSACHPCVHRTSIYLCGGNNYQSEVFDSVKVAFTLLPFTLPERQFGCVSFFSRGELVMLTTNYVCRWRSQGTLQSNHFEKLPCGCWTGRKQVLIDDTLFREAHLESIDVIDLVRGKRKFIPLQSLRL